MSRPRFHVYLLIDSRSHQPYYVGMTSHLERRLEQHCDPDHNRHFAVSKYTAKLTRRGLRPNLVVLETCAEEYNARIAELFWIELLSHRGIKLQNRKHHRKYLIDALEDKAMRGSRNRHGKAWEVEETEKLKRYHGMGLEPAEIALLLGRSERAVQLALEREK